MIFMSVVKTQLSFLLFNRPEAITGMFDRDQLYTESAHLKIVLA